ncbi:uncharacterized mitochondrial protein AtMg01250-like [Helianthus annuus]|uniref:uncharacterized mitochondrial protein AtMg01250-like n=1 Tax=Helianthus annuus TaxID=4232 RepID=UPI000B90463B|nr:uncharacterized mitochondrial protein AtMg01250-like [Helianthus annuus]
MEKMCFPDKWRKWIMGVISTARSSVLVNGSPTFEFKYSKGIRQGDPISPFLFLIGMEALTVLFNRAVEGGMFKGFETPNGGPYLSSLLFADDALIIGEWSDANATNMIRLLRCFHLISGLKINLLKSNLIGVGVNEVEVTRMGNRINCRAGKTPFVYLGLLVGANMNLIKNWQPVLDIFDSRLSGWKAKM